MESEEVEKICKNCYYYNVKNYECENISSPMQKMFPLCSCSYFTSEQEVITVENLVEVGGRVVKKITETIKKVIEKTRDCMARLVSRKK